MTHESAVVTVRSRIDAAWELSEFVYSMESLAVDDERDSNANHDAAWRMAHFWATAAETRESNAEWCVVFEDDAVPFNYQECPSTGYVQARQQFSTTLAQALRNAPTSVVSLYTGKGRPRPLQPRLEASLQRAELEGSPWLIDKNLHWGVAVAVRTELVPSMLDWVQRCDNEYDTRLGMWARGHGHRVSYTVPSLVDHADAPSAIHDDREPGRVAHRVLSRDEVVDWSGHPVWL